MIGAIYILNYGWTYAGMWQISKRVLPKAALERILFNSKEDMLVYFDREHLLTGKLRETCQLLRGTTH